MTNASLVDFLQLAYFRNTCWGFRFSHSWIYFFFYVNSFFANLSLFSVMVILNHMAMQLNLPMERTTDVLLTICQHANIKM